jgi:hypothetical protein
VCDRGRSRQSGRGPNPGAGTGSARETECPGVVEKSERLIVAMTPAERQEEQRGCSGEGKAGDECASPESRAD